MYYGYIKAAHVVFVVCWFAGLFYTPRLFIYTLDAAKKNEPERGILTKQLLLMTRKLWFIITWPAALLSLFFGVWLILLNPNLLLMGWFHIKLLLLIILILYHVKTHHFYGQIKRGTIRRSSTFMKFWNEIATLLLFSIIFTAILKDGLGLWIRIITTLALATIIIMGIVLYNRKK